MPGVFRTGWILKAVLAEYIYFSDEKPEWKPNKESYFPKVMKSEKGGRKSLQIWFKFCLESPGAGESELPDPGIYYFLVFDVHRESWSEQGD